MTGASLLPEAHEAVSLAKEEEEVDRGIRMEQKEMAGNLNLVQFINLFVPISV